MADRGKRDELFQSPIPRGGDKDPDPNFVDNEAVERLRQAVRAAGGARQVADRSGVPERSIGHYLGGRDMKRGTLVALADATGVNVEWLAAGRGPMRRGSNQPPPPQPSDVPQKLFQTVNMDMMGDAMAVARFAFRRRGIEPTDRRLMQVVAYLYDAMADPHTEIEQLAYIIAGHDPIGGGHTP